MNRAAIAICLLLLSGCMSGSARPPVEKDGVVYGIVEGAFQGQWWQYYQRGASFLDGGFLPQAEEDLREALRLWDGDQRRVRTYGRHLIDYFPHRELGVALYRQKRFPEALSELETSYSSEPSARAAFYLDMARQDWIEENKSDRRPPSIKIQSPGPDAVFNAVSVNLTGKARDDTYVKEVRINNHPVRIDLSQPAIAFEKEVALANGRNVISIQAKDITGKTAESTLVLHGDRVGPVLSIETIQRIAGAGGGIVIRGYAHDEHGVASVRVNGVPLPVAPGREIRLDHRSSSSLQDKVVITIKDLAGNRTQGEYPVMAATTAIENTEWRVFFRSMKRPYQILPFLADNQFKQWRRPPLLVQNFRGVVTSEKRLSRYEASGKSYALVIGVNSYHQWKPLKTAVNDALAMKDILLARYGYHPSDIRVRLDHEASLYGLMSDLKEMAGTLTKQDSLLVYYAGHGQLDPLTGNGYWVPVDGAKDDPSTWITHFAVKNILCSPAVSGKNILVIADSCYSGTFLRKTSQNATVRESRQGGARGGPLNESKFSEKTVNVIQAMAASPPGAHKEIDFEKRVLALARKRSRQVIASGGTEPVSDLGREGHSLFAYYLLKALRENQRTAVDIEYLFNTRVWGPVVDLGGQRPVMGRMATDMDENGQFILVLDPELRRRPNIYKASVQDQALRNAANEPRLDDQPPTMDIQGWRNAPTVYIEQALIEMRLQDPSGIQTVSVNGRKILKRPGNDLHLNYLANLEEGDNRLVFEFQDQLGNAGKKTIQIFRKKHKIFDIGARMSVMPHPLCMEKTDESNIKSLIGVESNLLHRLMESGRFQIQENPLIRKNMRQCGAGGVEAGNAVRNARRLNAEFALIGTVLQRGDSLQVLARLIEAETAKTVTSQDVYGENVDARLIQDLCQGLVVKLRDALPLLEGKVIETRQDSAIVDLGGNHRIKLGMHLIFYQKGQMIREPENGQILGMDIKQLGSGRIERLLPGFSHAEFLDGEAVGRMSKGCWMIMK